MAGGAEEQAEGAGLGERIAESADADERLDEVGGGPILEEKPVEIGGAEAGLLELWQQGMHGRAGGRQAQALSVVARARRNST